MSSSKVVKTLFVALAFFAALYLLASQFLGPGIGNASVPIVNGYEYDDAGGYEKAIIYKGSERPHQIVVDARVDDYKTEDDRLIVARRPRESHLAKDNALSSRLLPTCEYWVINVKTHQVEKTADSSGLRCN